MPRFLRPSEGLIWGLIVFLFLLLISLAATSPAHATGTVRLEYARTGGGPVLTAENVSSSGASAQGTAAPDFSGAAGKVRIRGIAGAVIVLVGGTNPVATQTNGFRYQSCDPFIDVPIQAGDKVAIIEATDASTCPSSGGSAVTLADAAHVTFGAQADGAASSDTQTTTFMGLFKRLLQKWTTGVQIVAGTAGGHSSYTYEVAASDNHQVIKNGAGIFYGFDAWSKHSAALYQRFYDAGTGFNGCNSATGLIWEGEIPANSTPANGAGLIRPFGATGKAFTNGLSACTTGAFGNTDTTSATASVASVNVDHK